MTDDELDAVHRELADRRERSPATMLNAATRLVRGAARGAGTPEQAARLLALADTLDSEVVPHAWPEETRPTG